MTSASCRSNFWSFLSGELVAFQNSYSASVAAPMAITHPNRPHEGAPRVFDCEGQPFTDQVDNPILALSAMSFPGSLVIAPNTPGIMIINPPIAPARDPTTTTTS